MGSKRPAVVVIDDHEVVVKSLVSRRRPYRVVGAASDAPTGEALVHRLKPDIALLNIGLGGSPWRTTRRIVERESARVLLLTGSKVPTHADLALEHGASGLADKSSPIAELEEAVLAVGRGDEFWGARWEQRVDDLRSGKTPAAVAALSERDEELLHLLALGYNEDTAAAQLGISDRTVRRDAERIRRMFNVQTITQAVAIAVADGLLSRERLE